MLANFLGYRAYNPTEQLFHLTRSKGFILELAPLIGADERISDILNSIFSDVLLPGCEFQIINYASPRIAEKLQEWALPRVRAGQVFDKLARYRLELLRKGAWTTLAGDGPFHLRHFRVLFAVGVGQGASISSEQLGSVREGIISAFDSINVASHVVEPTDLIASLTMSYAPRQAPATTPLTTALSIRSTSNACGAISSPASSGIG